MWKLFPLRKDLTSRKSFSLDISHPGDHFERVKESAGKKEEEKAISIDIKECGGGVCVAKVSDYQRVRDCKYSSVRCRGRWDGGGPAPPAPRHPCQLPPPEIRSWPTATWHQQWRHFLSITKCGRIKMNHIFDVFQLQLMATVFSWSTKSKK